MDADRVNLTQPFHVPTVVEPHRFRILSNVSARTAMRFLLKLMIVVGLLAACGFAASRPLMAYWKRRHQPVFRFADVERGTLRSTVNATGTIKPTLSVQIGTFVSGPIIELNADFNDDVQKDQVLARIDPALYNASVARDEAALDTRIAEVERVQAVLDQAVRDEKRALDLFQESEDFICAPNSTACATIACRRKRNSRSPRHP